ARASKMLSGPVSLKVGEKSWSISAKEIGAALTLAQKPGIPAPVLTLKDDSFKKLVDKIGGEVDQPKVNPRFDWNGGRPKLLRAGQDGMKLDREKAVSAVLSAIAGDARTVQLPIVVDQATAASVDPASLGLKDLIESATTSFAGSVPEKQHNIRTAAARLNGVLLAPGDVFSFNAELGPTTLKSGFQIGFGIAVTNGEMQTVPSVAGGICQVATTLLHSVFNAGYQIEERYPHAYWIQSYGLPPKGMTGLDATVDDPYLDFKFKNNTDNFVLIQTNVDGTTLEFDLYGTKPKWRVEIDKPVISNVVKPDPATVRQEEPTWAVGRELWVERATDGMDVVVTRRVIDGGEVRTLNLKSHYEPSRNVLMVGSAPPPPTATAGADATPAAPGTPGTPAAGPTAPRPTAAATQPAPAATKPAATPTPGR
ncbi:MAG TPA: VanW family protein, partial [Chloroflexota bacterium]